MKYKITKITGLLMKLTGTDFQIMVWKEIKKIPKGRVRTYKEIAVAISRPKASRAVANACGKNPFPLKIPCHSCLLYTSPSPRD